MQVIFTNGNAVTDFYPQNAKHFRSNYKTSKKSSIPYNIIQPNT